MARSEALKRARLDRFYQHGLTDTMQNRPSLAVTLWVAEEMDLFYAYVDGEQAAMKLLDPLGE